MFHFSLKEHLDKLSQAQREILIESFYNGGKRADIGARSGITISTYDNHRQAAFKALREALAANVKRSTCADRSLWYGRVEELIARRAARERDRSATNKGKRSTAEGKRDTSEGEGGNTGHEGPNTGGEGANTGGEERNTGGKGRNTGGKGRNTEGEGRNTGGKRPQCSRQTPQCSRQRP